ncbi:MAG: acyltransferase [Bdellovibrionales bacterium]|nr:acyltransferase [Bdellovibrionales bacterium]
MLKFLPPFIKAPIAFGMFLLNTVIWCCVLFLFTFVKIITPPGRWRLRCSRWLTAIAENWNTGNELITDLTQDIDWDIQVDAELSPDESYLLLANHQSWVDIVVLERVFNRRIPFIRFFIKKQLFWVPFLGPSWWALDFPFMSRHSEEYLKKHPERRGQDLVTARKRCERFRLMPTSVLIFAEGTRFREEKRKRLSSPFAHLLPPKAGGVSTVMEVMGDQFARVLDVTIVYPQGETSFFALFSGRLKRVVVRVRTLELPRGLVPGEARSDDSYDKIKQWVRAAWGEKDKLIGRLEAVPI